jgi:hypothetical protein
MNTKSDMTRINLYLAVAQYDQLEAVSRQHHVTAQAMLRRMIDLGLKAWELQSKPDSGVIFRENGKDEQVRFF